MRTTMMMVAGVAGLLAAARPAEAQFYRWGPEYRPFHRYYGYPFYRPVFGPRYAYAVPPPFYFYYPPPYAYEPPPGYERPPVGYERPSTYRRPRPLHRPIQPAAARPLPSPPPKLPARSPSHDLYPPESY